MSITNEEINIIEAWTGATPDGDDRKVETMLRDLGSAYAVALQILSTRRSKFTMTPADVSANGDRVSHQANIKAIDGQIALLVGYLTGNTDVTLTEAAKKLLASASGATLEETRNVPMTVINRRRAG